MKNNNSYIAGLTGPPTPVESHHNSVQQPSVATSNKAVLESKHSDRETKVTKARGVSKKQVDTEQELQESRQRWQSESDVIARIIQLGKKLGHQPTLLDLYCAGFEPAEIDAISDLLRPLLASDEDAEIVSDSGSSDLNHQSDIQYFETPLTMMALYKEQVMG